MPKVSISLSKDIADAIKQEGKSLNEVVKEIVLQYAREKTTHRPINIHIEKLYIIIKCTKDRDSE
jgi:hypothetical protein